MCAILFLFCIFTTLASPTWASETATMQSNIEITPIADVISKNRSVAARSCVWAGRTYSDGATCRLGCNIADHCRYQRCSNGSWRQIFGGCFINDCPPPC